MDYEPIISLLASYTPAEIEAIMTLLTEFKKANDIKPVQKKRGTISEMLHKELDRTVPAGGETPEQRFERGRPIFYEIVKNM
jgi:hypothetical protein